MLDTGHDETHTAKQSGTERQDAEPHGLLPTPERPTSQYALHTAIGFVCGAVFWHLIGFWSFVSDTIHNGSEFAAQPAKPRIVAKFDARKIESALSDTYASQQSTKQPPLTTGSISKVRQNCSTLALNRISGRVETHPCTLRVLAHHRQQATRRQDMIRTISIRTPQNIKGARTPAVE